MRQENVSGENLLRGGVRVQVCHAAVSGICLWPLRRDDNSGVLAGAGGTRRSDCQARVLANDVSTGIVR